MSARDVALVFGLVLLQAVFIKDTQGQDSTCQNLDLAFLIDGSGSICDNTPNYNFTHSTTCGNWEFIRQFVYRFVDSLDISPDTTRVAVATFADSAILLWNLTTYPDKTSLLNAINTTLKYPKGETHTTEGLNLLINQVFVPPFDRPNVRNMAIIITDGKPTNRSTVNASIEAVHRAGIKTLVVGVTNQTDNDTLKLLSSDPRKENKTYFWATNFETIDQLRPELTDQACQLDCQNLDLAFLIDGSGSICDSSPNYNFTDSTCDNWEFIRQFVYQFVNSLEISPDATRVAVATFADSAILLWNLTAYPNKLSLLNAINTTLKYPKGQTHTSEGLYLMTTHVFVPPFDRPNISNSAIIITDGKPTTPSTVPAAIDAVHRAGIRTLVVGVTDQVDIDTLKLLSSPPQVANVTYFWTNDFKTIDQMRPELTDQACRIACDQIDLCFIVDRSGSICDNDKNFNYTWDNTCKNWASIVTFIHDLVNNSNIGPSNVRVALVIFDDTARLIWGLGTYTDKVNLLDAINRLQYIKGGTTDTTGGLDMARTQVFGTADDRLDVTNVAIIITDGKPTVPSTVENAVKALQGDQGGRCKTFVVGITDSINVDTLRLLSSPPKEAGKTYFMAANYTAVNMMSISILALTCPQPTTVPTPHLCPDVQDVVIVLDGSGSICDSDPGFNFPRDTTCNNWKSILQFLHNLTTRFVISPSATRVAFILFSDVARLVWGLDGYADKDTLLYAIDTLQYIKGGTTNTTGALNVLNSQVFTPQSIRSNAAKTAIIVTDGKPTVPSTVPAAINAVLTSGIRSLVVGVTNQVDNQTLRLLSSPPKTLGQTYFIATDYKTIDAEITMQLIDQTCQGTSRPTTPTTSGPTIPICTAKLDLAFVVDRSGSICGDRMDITSCGNWTDTLKFIHGIVESLSIGLDQTRVGMIIFASKEDTKVLWNLTAHTDKNTLLKAIDAMQYVAGGTTYTADGLNLLTSSMFNGSDDRPDVNNTAIIITDGKPTDNAMVPAAIDAVHNARIKTIVVGITNSVDNSTLAQLSSPPQQEGVNYFMATDFSSLAALGSELQKQTCGA